MANTGNRPKPQGQHPLYEVPLPYPKVFTGSMNPAYGRAMLSNVGGINSEMSAVSLYLYNHFVTPQYPEISEAFRKMAEAEMRHLEIFGTLAYQLGQDPRLWSNRCGQRTYWTPGYHRYPVQLPRMLGYALESERAAIQKYQRQAEMIQDENIRENLRRIILDEEAHVEFLRYLKGKYA
ncbi:MAG: ferritin-like domain-containing protein [Oscillospiraceae bacterium]|jgi:bacterioferritin